MASADRDPEDPVEARRLLIQLFDAGEFRITERARREGIPILPSLGIRYLQEGGLVRYVMRLLRRGHELRRMIRGDPPDSRPRGWCMKNCDGSGLFIEMTVEEVKMGQPVAVLISFHH